MGLAGMNHEERFSSADWRARYRWPDPDLGWVGGLAGYPPDDSARGGRACPPGVVWPDEAWYAPPPGYEGRPYDSSKGGGEGPWRAGSVTETPLFVPKLVTETPSVTETGGDVTETPRVGGRPKKDGALTAAERMRLSRARKRGE
jgi:hypothetical protein